MYKNNSMKNSFLTLALFVSFITFGQTALHYTENPQGGKNFPGTITSVSIFEDRTNVLASFTVLKNRMYWNSPTNAYIRVQGSSKKYKLLEIHKVGGPWSTSGQNYTKLDLDGSYFSKGEKWEDYQFAFVFEKIPSGFSSIDVILSGKEVFSQGVYFRTKRWSQIYSSFTNVIIINPSQSNQGTNNKKRRKSKSL